MAREINLEGVNFTEDGTEEYALDGVQIEENQAAAGEAAEFPFHIYYDGNALSL